MQIRSSTPEKGGAPWTREPIPVLTIQKFRSVGRGISGEGNDSDWGFRRSKSFEMMPVDERKEMKKKNKLLRGEGRTYQQPKRVPVYLLIADDHKDATSMVYGICWTLIPHAKTSQEAGALFASIIAAYAPDLLNAMIVPLQEAGCEINELRVPTESTDYGYHFDLENSYSHAEIVIFIGVSLMLPFKNLSEKNYASFVKARVKALGGSLSPRDERLSKMKYPLDLTRAEMVKRMFAGNKELKQEILRYLMWASEQKGLLGGMGRYASMILAWNEMNMIVSINSLLVNSKSPVLDHVSIQDEVANFSKAWYHIEKSPCPRYFRYFCTEAEEKLIQRRNLPTLCAVAQEILNMKSKNRSIVNFAGTSERGALVQELVEMNLNRVVTESAAIKFLFDEGDYDELSD
ncbi:hypothetical protein L1987_00578 [Smallanthus sonchifolius]|uniref:Uncharacterized protein n=1 Tax=Smallanthus sonchifolius TaxID=185202 RepID=A0ACB9K2I7_9ASTR|nr:hypothetical protein L1987_00578 [Smallanthus sonchifolius]